MEPKFQTSFIPKKTAAPATSLGIGNIKAPKAASHVGSSIFMLISTVLFVVSVAALGGSYLWRSYLLNQQESYKKDLADREQQFNISLISQLKSINVQIDSARQLLSNHIAVSQIFGILSKFTVADVGFLNMDLTTPANPSSSGGSASNGVKITMGGQSSSLTAVAFQSDVLASLSQYGLGNIVKNPIISDPSISDKGLVSFSFTATIDPASLSYETEVNGPSASNSSTTSP